MSSWLKVVLPIAGIFSSRMMGLFMLIPVFSVLAGQLNHATPALIGIALGSYGLSQGLLQIPFGLLSDKFGRKPLIAIGLILFLLGSVIGAFATSIYGMIAARMIQGMGAIGSVLIALLADLTTDEHRTKAMAVVGMVIGLSFGLAFVISPILTDYFGLAGIFYITIILALFGLWLLFWVIPSDLQPKQSTVNIALFREALRDRQLLPLNLGIFFQHLILTTTFFAVPLLVKSPQWHFYLPLMLFSFVSAFPLIMLAERKQKNAQVFNGTLWMTIISQIALMLYADSTVGLFIWLFIYFIAFNFLEATLPSLVSKKAHKNKGTAMGIYSTCQFLGIFAGGVLGGWLFQLGGIQAIFMVNVLISLSWFFISHSLNSSR